MNISGSFVRRLWKTVLPFCLVIFIPSLMHAAEFPFQFSSRTWQTDEGLPHNNVRAIAQTQDSYLWVGTQKGLARFDGLHFRTFDQNEIPGLKNPAITTLLATKDGGLWVGTAQGLHRWHNDKWQSYFVADGLSNDDIRALHPGQHGDLWIGTVRGFSHWENGRFTNFDLKVGEASDAVRSFHQDPDGTLWIAARSLHVLKDGKLELFEAAKTLAIGLRVIYRAKNGDLWIGSGGGLAHLRDGVFRLYTKEDGLDHNNVISLGEDSRGNLCVGTSGGLCRWVDGQFWPEFNSEDEAFDEVSTMLEDVEGNLWIGAKDGLSRLRPQLFASYTRKHGLTANNVMSVFQDHQDTIWIATWGGGLHFFDELQISKYPLNDRPQSQRMLSVFRGLDGTLWIGLDFDGGLLRKRGDEILQYWKGEYGLIDSAIRVICQDREGFIWLGTRTALVKLDLFDDKPTRFTKAEGLAGNLVQVIHEDRTGQLWIGTDGGLTRKNEERFTNYRTENGLSDNNITAIYEDKENVLWIGTRHGGLNRWKDGKFTACAQKDGLFQNHIFEILEDDFGAFWMSSLQGIFRVKKSDLNDFLDGKTPRVNCVSFGKADGMASTQCNGVAKPAGIKTRDGRLWFATTKGLVVTDPALQVFNIRTPPPVVIENVLFDKQRIEVQSSRFKMQSQRTDEASSTLKLGPGRGEVEFQFTALSFRAPEKNQFKYKLEGFDHDWIEAGTRRVASYSRLPPGEYSFHVTASGDDGVWNSEHASVHLSLLPHFWQTKWFAGLAGLLALGLVAGTVRYFIWRRVQHRLIQLDNQHAIERERARIAQDMHDDLGARLTQILMLNDFALKSKGNEAEIKTHVTKVARVTQDLVRNLDAIVWAVNPENDSLRSLALYLCEYFEMFFCPSTLRYRLDAPKEFPEWPMSSEMRHNIFLVVKEALNNIVKHADASEVWLRLRVDETTLKICIEDNGHGFSESPESAFSSGLVNMRKRIEKCGGQFALNSRPQKGTTVEIVIAIRSTELAPN